VIPAHEFCLAADLPLVAILSSGMIASPEALSLSWGYSIDDKVRLSRDCKRRKDTRIFEAKADLGR
jgi:hypothetical protein